MVKKVDAKMICSFFKNRKCIETLDEHVRTMLNFYRLFFYNNGWHIYSSTRLKSIGYNYTGKELDIMARIMILFHDAGKLFYQHLKNHFPNHEVYSAIIVLGLKEQLKPFFKQDGNRAVEAITSSIILHHISMNRLKKGFSDLIMKQDYSLEKKLFQEYKYLLEKMLFEHGFKLNMSEISKYFSHSSRLKLMLSEIYGMLHRKIVLGHPTISLYQLVLRLLRILMITDNYAAAKLRGGALRLFIRDLPSIESIDRAKKVLAALAK